MDNISASLLQGVFRHVRSWLSNLDRAGLKRKQQSVQALRDVITAARETAVYMRQMKDTGERCHRTESHLSVRASIRWSRTSRGRAMPTRRAR